MKKLLLLLTIPALLMTGCNQQKKKVDISKLKIVAPTGAPAFAFYKEANNQNFETNSVPSNIVSMMSASSDKDIVVIDTTSGVKAINNGAPYKLAATITFGNFYIAATGNDTNSHMDPGDRIILFGEHQTPDLLFHYLYGNVFDSGIEYVTNVQNAAQCLIKGKNDVTGTIVDYVFVAQPVLYNAMQKKTTIVKYLDIQQDYYDLTGGKEMIQASVFIKNTVEKKVGDAFLTNLQSNINAEIMNPNVINDNLGSLDETEVTSLYGVSPSVATAVMQDGNGLGLGFKKAFDNKENVESFLSLFDINNLDEEVYYK